MHKMSPISSIPIALHIRAWRIPIDWTVRESCRPQLKDVDGRILDEGGIERVYCPRLANNRWGKIEPTEIENPLELRVQLFKMLNAGPREEAVLAFLNSVGAWRVIQEDRHESWTEGSHSDLMFGHRQITGMRALPLTLEDFRHDAKEWYGLLGVLHNPAKLKAEFRQPPPADARPSDLMMYSLRSHFANTLPVSLEWHGRDPYAVVETVTVWELMIAAAWADVVGRAEKQVCAYCKTRFTWHREKKYCSWDCGHYVAVRKYKRKIADQKRQEKVPSRR